MINIGHIFYMIFGSCSKPAHDISSRQCLKKCVIDEIVFTPDSLFTQQTCRYQCTQILGAGGSGAQACFLQKTYFAIGVSKHHVQNGGNLHFGQHFFSQYAGALHQVHHGSDALAGDVGEGMPMTEPFDGNAQSPATGHLALVDRTPAAGGEHGPPRSISYQLNAAKFPNHRDLAGFAFESSALDLVNALEREKRDGKARRMAVEPPQSEEF
jgi:hypothetical protein